MYEARTRALNNCIEGKVKDCISDQNDWTMNILWDKEKKLIKLRNSKI